MRAISSTSSIRLMSAAHRLATSTLARAKKASKQPLV